MDTATFAIMVLLGINKNASLFVEATKFLMEILVYVTLKPLKSIQHVSFVALTLFQIRLKRNVFAMLVLFGVIGNQVVYLLPVQSIHNPALVKKESNAFVRLDSTSLAIHANKHHNAHSTPFSILLKKNVFAIKVTF